MYAREEEQKRAFEILRSAGIISREEKFTAKEESTILAVEGFLELERKGQELLEAGVLPEEVEEKIAMAAEFWGCQGSRY